MPFSLPQTLAPNLCASSPRGLAARNGEFSLAVYRSQIDPLPGLVLGRWRSHHGNVCLVGDRSSSSSADAAPDGYLNKRSIVEHLFLLSAKTDLSEDEEKDMLDHLYTSQYQMSGILAISLGRIVDPNVDNITHAVFMRFQKKEDVAKFYINPYYSGVLKGHVIPYCYGSISVDYESKVEDDILSIFRRGEEFNYGVECIILLSVFKTALQHDVDDALSTLEKLFIEFGTFITQATQGSNFNLTESEYTHAAVIRFPSFEAFQIFRESQQYKDMWSLKFYTITKKALVIHFAVDPVGSELM